MDETEKLEYNVSHIVLVGFYIGLLFAIFHRMHRLKTTGNLSQLWQRTFMIMLLLGTVTRCIFFALQPFIVWELIVVLNFINVCLNVVPSFFFFSCYLIILFLWAEIYHSAYGTGKHISKLRPIYFTVVIVMYLTVIIILILDWLIYRPISVKVIPDPSTPLEKGLFVFDAGLYLATALGFCIYGGSFYMKFVRGGPLLTKMRETVLPKVKILTILCTLCFMARALLTIISMFARLDEWIWLDLVYYVSMEFIPLILMLVILRPARPNLSQDKRAGSGSGTIQTVYSPLIINDKKNGSA